MLDRGRDWSYMAKTLGMPKIARLLAATRSWEKGR